MKRLGDFVPNNCSLYREQYLLSGEVKGRREKEKREGGEEIGFYSPSLDQNEWMGV